MAIKKFPKTVEGQTAAFAVPDPKNVTFTGEEFEVRDGADYAAPPPASKDEIDVVAAKSYKKLEALSKMSPAEVQTWVAANVTNLAQAQDAIATLAIAVSVLIRKL